LNLDALCPYVVAVDPSPLGAPYYPTNDFGPMMKGMIIGGLGIFHVFLAQFAIGGGMLMTYFEYLSGKGRLPQAKHFLHGYFRFLVLISFVVGALTGVGMWFTSIQVSARTIGMMVDTFHWVWAIEWCFFGLEVIAGYCFYRYGEKLDHPTRLKLLAMYTIAAWFSLFWINGILSWQLTPGAWLQNHDLWAGFFNPGFWPSLLFRSVAAAAIAALVAAVVINAMTEVNREDREALLHKSAHLLAPMGLMPVLGAWYLWSLPADSRSWILGGSPAMSMFFGVGAGASALIGVYAIFGLLLRRLYVNGATATLLVALGFAASAGGEFVREGARKPFTIRETLYSNSMTPSEIASMREVGSVSFDPYPLRNEADYPTAQLVLGAKVYRFQCSVCHTIEGMNGIAHLAGTWTDDQKRLNIAKLQLTKPFMPPFAGTPEEVEALVQLIGWEAAGRPKDVVETHDAAVLADIKRFLDEAGTRPGYSLPTRRTP
jgi:mono/diheme cytochrome c family protein